MIPRRVQIAIFVGLLVVLAWVVSARMGRGPELGGVLFANEKFEPLGIQDPTLRLDLLERVRKLEYKGTHRNIFSASLPRPPQEQQKIETPVVPPQPVNTGPPPLQVPYRFYGFKENPRTGRRTAFFTDGDNVYIAAEGETIRNQFRVLKIGNQTCDVEEISSGRRATLQLEAPPQ
jgi:hypothetical protein